MYQDKTRYGQDPSRVVRSKTTFHAPLTAKFRGAQYVFTCSWSDFFIEDADAWRPEAWDIIRQTPHLTYQILTKRPERIPTHLPADWGPGWRHVWLGVSVETALYVPRITLLQSTPAALRFLSLEPLLAPLSHLPLAGIGWVIVGGESGPQSRPLSPLWVRDIQQQCATAAVPFFFKQWGGTNKKAAGRLLDGRTWDAMPLTPKKAL